MSALSSDQLNFIRTFIMDLPDPDISDMLELSGFEVDLAQADQEPEGAPDPDAEAWAARFVQLEPRIARALSAGDVANPGGLRATWALAVEQADGGLAGAALELIPRIEALLADTVASRADGPPEGHVEFMQLVLDWHSQKSAFERQLDELAVTLAAEADDPEEAADGAPQKLRQALAGFDQGLSQKIEAVQEAAFPLERKQQAGEAITIAQSYLDYVEGDPLIAHLRQNPYEVEVDATAMLGAPLRRIVAHLSAAA